MSSGFEAYLIRPDAMRTAIGSADVGVLHAIRTVRMRDDDRAAVVGLINARAPESHPLRALRSLCLALGGEMLPNDRWMPCSMGYIEAVDQALAAAGVEARIWDLASGLSCLTGGFGVALGPETRAGGYSTAEVHTMRARFSGAEKVAAEYADAASQAAGWFERAAAASTGLLIIGV